MALAEFEEAGDVHDVKLRTGPKGVKKFQSEAASTDYSYKRKLTGPGHTSSLHAAPGDADDDQGPKVGHRPRGAGGDLTSGYGCVVDSVNVSVLA